MKAFYLFLALSLCIVSCNSDTAETTTTTPPATTQKAPTPSNTPPTKTSSQANNSKDAGAFVERTEVVPEAPVQDEGVDYQTLATAACQCGNKLLGTEESHVGQKHVDANSTEYQAEVDCFMAAKNKMTKNPISRQKLIGLIKDSCADLPGTLVMRIMMTLAQ